MAKTYEVIIEQPEEFMPSFLVMCPVPPIEDPKSTPENPLPLIPKFTDDEWLVEWIINDLDRAYRHGKDKQAKELAVKQPKTVLFKCKIVENK